jgi:hypothetical protein
VCVPGENPWDARAARISHAAAANKSGAESTSGIYSIKACRSPSSHSPALRLSLFGKVMAACALLARIISQRIRSEPFSFPLFHLLLLLLLMRRVRKRNSNQYKAFFSFLRSHMKRVLAASPRVFKFLSKKG